MHQPPTFAPYAARPIRFLELYEAAGTWLKVYGIRHGGGAPPPALVAAGKSLAAAELAAGPQLGYGVGFLGVHAGRGADYAFLDRWVNENELHHRFWIGPKDAPAQLHAPAAGDGAVCVWDLHLQYQERLAWIECVLANPRGPDLAAYLARRYEGSA